MTPQAQGALEVARLGHDVLPLWGVVVSTNGVPNRCECPQGEGCSSAGKHPRLRGDWKRLATNNPERIEHWERRYPLANYAYALDGTPALAAIDVDPRHGGNASGLPRTNWMVTSGGGGLHIVGRRPEGVAFPNGLSAGVEIKAVGRYLVCPGSMHISGKRYRFLVHPGDDGPVEFPPDLFQTPATTQHDGQRSKLADLLANPPQHEGDGRNVWMTAVAGHYAKALAHEDAYRASLRAANALLAEPLSGDELEKTSASIWTAERGKQTKSGDLVLIKASSIRPRPVRFLWSGRVPVRGLTLLAGQQGDGKSTLSFELAAQASTGRLEGEHFGRPVSSLFLTTEDDWESVIVPRLIAAGANLELVHAVYVDRDRQQTGLVLPDDIGILGEAFRRTDARLASIDPLLAHIGRGVDTHKDQHVRQVTSELDQIAQGWAAAVLGLVHFTKATEVKDILYRVMGSQGLTAAARSVLGVFKDQNAPKTARLLVHIKSNWSAYAESLSFTVVEAEPFDNDEGETIRPSRLAWTGPRTDIDRFNVLSASESEITPEQSEVLVILAEDGPLSPAEVHARRKGAGRRSESATRHLLGKLRERGLVWADDQHSYNVQEGANVRLF